MTLIELLVVIVILTTLVAAAIPLMSPTNDDRRLREAARGLNTYITGAQARAIALNRPYGIALKRLVARHDKQSRTTTACASKCFTSSSSRRTAGSTPTRGRAWRFIRLRQPRYLTHASFVSSPAASVRPLPLIDRLAGATDPFPTGTIRPGDVIEINGTRFELLSDESPVTSRSWSIRYDGFNALLLHVRNWQRLNSVQIMAQPLNDSGQQINPRYDNNGNEIGSAVSRREAAALTGRLPVALQNTSPADAHVRRAVPASGGHGDRPAGLGRRQWRFSSTIRLPRTRTIGWITRRASWSCSRPRAG